MLRQRSKLDPVALAEIQDAWGDPEKRQQLLNRYEAEYRRRVQEGHYRAMQEGYYEDASKPRFHF